MLIAAPSGVIDLTEDDVSANVAHSLRTPGSSLVDDLVFISPLSMLKKLIAKIYFLL